MVSNSWVLALYGVSTLFASSEAVTFRLPVKSREVEEAETKWGTIWTAAPQLVEPDNLPPEPFVCSYLLGYETSHSLIPLQAVEGIGVNET